MRGPTADLVEDTSVPRWFPAGDVAVGATPDIGEEGWSVAR